MSLTGYLEDLTGKGVIVSRQANNPAAGNNFLETVPAGERWHPLGCTFKILTSASTVTRKANVIFIGGGGIKISQDYSDFPLINAQTGDYNFNIGSQNASVVPGSGVVTIQADVKLSMVMLSPGNFWTLGSSNLQALDQIQDIILHYLKFNVT